MGTVVAETSGGGGRGREDDGVISFLGIPHAAPPVGAARFRPAAPAAPWNDVRDALAYGPACPQPRIPVDPKIKSATGQYLEEAQSEDCLTINVWTSALGPSGG